MLSNNNNNDNNAIELHLQNCLSSNNAIRKDAEHIIQSKFTSDYVNTLNICCDILTNENKATNIRQLCATCIKNLLNKEEYVPKWEQTEIQMKNTIKQKILSCLASSVHEIRLVTSLVVSSICKLELPKRQWNDIVDILCATSQHENINFKLSSLITIGYIAQDVDTKDLTQEQVSAFLNAINLNMNAIENCNDNDIIILKQAIIAFYKLLPFIEANFQVVEQRCILLNKLITLIEFYNNDDIKLHTLQCLVEIARLYYNYLHNEMNNIAPIVCKYMKHANMKISIQAIEFWCSLTEKEQALHVNDISSKYENEIFIAIQEVFLNRNIAIEKTIIDEYTPLHASTYLIISYSLCNGDSFVDKVLKFIGSILHSDNYLLRDSAYMAFGGLVEYSQLKDDIIIASTMQVLDNVINEIKYPTLCKTMIWAFMRLCKHHFNVFDAHKDFFDKTIEKIFRIFCSFANNTVILYLTCNSLKELIENMINIEYFTPYCATLLDTLIKMAYAKGAYNSDTNIALSSFYTIEKIINRAEPAVNDIIMQFFSVIYNYIMLSLDIRNFASQEEQETYQGYLCLIVSSACGKISMNDEQVKAVYQYIKQTFINRQCIYPEGIAAASALSKANFNYNKLVLKDFMPYLLLSLDSISNVLLCKEGLLGISELLRFINGDDLMEYLNEIVQKIFTILNDTTCDKSLKNKCFLFISDLFMIESEHAYQFYTQTMQVINTAMNAAILNVSEEDDVDLFEYFNMLREHLVEVLTAINIYMKNMHKMEEFEPYVADVVKFVNTIIRKEYNSSIAVLSNCIGIICDMVIDYTMIAISGVDKDNLRRAVIEVERNDKSKSELINWAKNVIAQYNLV